MKPLRHSPSSASPLQDEKGAWVKKWRSRLPIALVFPSTYHIGMSNLGFQLVYELLNRDDDIVCERLFYPESPESPFVSVESGRLLRDFPVVCFSVSFEQDFVHILNMLKAAGIDLQAERRQAQSTFGPGNPLLIGGGVATFINPEPLAPFFDLFLLGEVENTLSCLMEEIKNDLKQTAPRRFLENCAMNISGCYVPSNHLINYAADGTISQIKTKSGMPETIGKPVLREPKGLNVGHSTVLSSRTEFADVFLTELGRGCSRGCRFCAAGYVYRPPRLWPAEKIIQTIETCPEHTNRVGLLGMEMVAKGELAKVVNRLATGNCSLSFSSLRADVIDDALLELLSKSQLKSVAIAPDGGSERLRRVINKHISEEEVLSAAERLAREGIFNLKLYFMIGLPTETVDDIDELIGLVKKIQQVILPIGQARGRLSEIVLSINSFVPKAWTPFQYHGFEKVSSLKKKMKYLRNAFAKVNNVRMKADNPEKAYFQAVLARGDRRLAEALYLHSQTHLPWKRVLKECGLSPQFYAERFRDQNEIFPWDIINHKISKKYLWQEYQQALRAVLSKGCERFTKMDCVKCGVCDA